MDKGNYERLGTGDDAVPATHSKNAPSWHGMPKQLICIHTMLLGLSAAIFVTSLAVLNTATSPYQSIRSTSFYSPVLEKVELPMSIKQVVDTRYSPNDPFAIYREPPSPQVDAAWDRISDVQAIMVSTNEVEKLRKDPSRTVRAPEAWGYGPDAHWAEIDVFHQIHCLNSIRQALYSDYYIGKDNNTNPLAWGHITHCLHNLVQSLMCSASADVVTYNWIEGKPKPVPDFNINHKCRDFEKLLKWQNEHKLENPKERWEEIQMPDGFDALPPDLSGIDEEE